MVMIGMIPTLLASSPGKHSFPIPSLYCRRAATPGKSKIRISKSETNRGQISQNPEQFQNDESDNVCLEHCIFGHLNLFRILVRGASFVLRIFSIFSSPYSSPFTPYPQ